MFFCSPELRTYFDGLSCWPDFAFKTVHIHCVWLLLRMLLHLLLWQHFCFWLLYIGISLICKRNVCKKTCRVLRQWCNKSFFFFQAQLSDELETTGEFSVNLDMCPFQQGFPPLPLYIAVMWTPHLIHSVKGW